MATYGGATSVNLVSPGLGHWTGTSFNLDTSQNTTTSRFFELDSVGLKGVEIRNNNRFYVNSDNNTQNPTHVRVNNGSWASDVPISDNDTVNISHDGSNVLATWIVTTAHLWTSSSGAGTLGSSFQTANFDGTTTQQIQWAIKNGSSPTPNANYYLFDESPGGTSKDSINIGSSPVAGGTSTSNYTNTSGAPFTGVWYVGYGQDATRVNLATYNFNPSKRKVHCNFW